MGKHIPMANRIHDFEHAATTLVQLRAGYEALGVESVDVSAAHLMAAAGANLANQRRAVSSRALMDRVVQIADRTFVGYGELSFPDVS